MMVSSGIRVLSLAGDSGTHRQFARCKDLKEVKEGIFE
jgi:hypothetical protein